MTRLILLALSMLSVAAAQQAREHWLLTFQLAPGIDLAHLTPEQRTVLMEHGKHVSTLYAKGLVVGGRTSETIGTLAIAILACDEATAKAAVSDDPASRAGYLKGAVHPFDLLMPPVLPAALVSDARANYEQVAKDVLDAARKMPAEQYGFRPTPDAPSFAQLVGRLADAEYAACGETARSVKQEPMPALESAVAFCRESWAKLTPGSMGALNLATARAFESYGRMMTYLQIKGIVRDN
jgi:uncharacterized protein YciI